MMKTNDLANRNPSVAEDFKSDFGGADSTNDPRMGGNNNQSMMLPASIRKLGNSS
jgi:hypothetical protein